MKLTIPRKNQGKPKGGHHRRRYGKPTWLAPYGRQGPSGQKPQSPVKEWADMTPAKRKTILERVK